MVALREVRVERRDIIRTAAIEYSEWFDGSIIATDWVSQPYYVSLCITVYYYLACIPTVCVTM